MKVLDDGFKDTILFYGWFIGGLKVDCYWVLDGVPIRGGLQDGIKLVMEQ